MLPPTVRVSPLPAGRREAPPTPAKASQDAAPQFRELLGFRDEGGTHSSRTLMLAELRLLLAATPPAAVMQDFRHAVVVDNVLEKRTATTREHTVRKLKALYGLDPTLPVYRILRTLWDHDTQAQPLLALLCAVARDPLLRGSVDAVLPARPGVTVTAATLEATVSTRFSEKTRHSIGVNLASTWTQAGFLSGVQHKLRTRPHATVEAVTYALALGAMEGGRGSLLLDTLWTRLLDLPADELLTQVKLAARRGWIEYRGVGNVVDIRLRNLLTPDEQRWCDGQSC